LKVIQLHKKDFNKRTIDLLKKQDRDAQQMVYTKYAPKMLSVCRQYIKDTHFAENIMLDGFLKVFTKIEKYQFKGSFEGWIRRIMINESISFLRLKKYLVFIDDDSFFKEETTIEVNEIESDNDVSELQNLLDNLREDLRVVFNLFVVEEYKHKEIAEMLEITENASKLRYRKAKEVLQKQYNSLNLKRYE